MTKEWQLCPKCNGTGNIRTIGEYASTTAFIQCDVCFGAKILIKPTSDSDYNQLLQESNSIIKQLQTENQELQAKVYELEADYMEIQEKLQTTDFKIKRVT